MITIIYNPDNNAVIFEEKRFSYTCITCGREEEILLKSPIIDFMRFHGPVVRYKNPNDEIDFINQKMKTYYQDKGFLCKGCLSIKDIIE